ncbi:MAG: NADH-quinone oxidoreductase subunit C [Firmicutes bacterium]|nr:NADH-quinone oxidoreductase subunit C [Candidatus Fermentithermobacillaceae bacterium]
MSLTDHEPALETEEDLTRRVMDACPDLGLVLERIRPRRIWMSMPSRNVRAMFSSLKGIWPEMHLSTITGLDTGSAIEVIYHFVLEKILVSVRIGLDPERPQVDTVSDILPVADAYERELHDVLGVEFSGRDSTPRLVLPDSWPEGYYPLRKSAKGGEKDVGHGDTGGTSTPRA